MSTNASSYKIASNLHLVRQVVPVAAKPKVVDLPVNHIVVIDCSGSMSGDLPNIRRQLKNKLPMLLREKDTISIVWFSGRGEYGTLIENLPVKSVTDLSGLNNAIDRFLRPVGLTGFKQPLDEAGSIINRIVKANPTGLFSLFFMSDGYDNQWSEREILASVKELQDRLSSAVFVEYGYYCNRPLMTRMAEQAGAALIFSEDFPRYEPVFENAMQKRLGGAKKIEIDLAAVPEHALIFGMVGGDLLTFAPSNGKVLVPENVGSLYYLSADKLALSEDTLTQRCSAGIADDELVGALYGGIALLAQRMKANDVFKLLKVVGDAALIEQFSNCFGKQKYSDFQEAASKAAFEPSTRFSKGYNPNLVPRDDAFTVLDLLRILSEDENNRFHPDHELFEYKRVGRKAMSQTEMLTESEQQEIADLTAKAKTQADLKKVQDRMAAILAAKPASLDFKADPAPDGYSVSNLVLNEERPNVSAQVKKSGTVDLSAILTEEAKAAGVPEKFPSFVYRNYTIIRDGILNVNTLPITPTQATFEKLVAEGVLTGSYTPNTVYMVDLRSLPIINRKMVNEVSAKRLFELQYELEKVRADQKVYKDYEKKNFGARTSAGFSAMYGDAVAAWLKEQGLTDYSGFSPKTTLAESTDFYMGKELKVAIKGLSSLPKVDDVIKKMGDSKKEPTISQAVMMPAIKDVQAFLDSDAYKNAANRDDVFKVWLSGKAKSATARARSLIYMLAQIKFSIVVGQVWFTEFASLDENTMTLKLDGRDVECRVEQNEVQVKI